MNDKFNEIHRALKDADKILGDTVNFCQSLADEGEGFVCTGCPAMLGQKQCAIQEIRDIITKIPNTME